MALIIATGLVVDDAIVVLENIARHINNGKKPLQAAIDGAREVGFTLLSMNLSLVVVFVSILFMGGLIERLFREFSITLTVAILISLLVSLTLTPMLCARWLRPSVVQEQKKTNLMQRFGVTCRRRLSTLIGLDLTLSTLDVIGLAADHWRKCLVVYCRT